MLFPHAQFIHPVDLGKTTGWKNCYVPQYLAVMEYIKKGIHHLLKKLSNLSVRQKMVR